MNYIDKVLGELKEKHNCKFKGDLERVAIDKWGAKSVNAFWNDIKQSLLTLQEQHKKEYEDGIKKAVDYISFNEGWEETGDKYRKHFGLKEKFNKPKYEK